MASYELRLTGFNRSAYVTMGHANDTGITDAVAIASNLLDAFGGVGSMMTRLDNNVVNASCTVRLGQDGADPIVGTDTGSIAGSRSGESPSPNVAVLIHKRTAAGGRRNRGRMFVPWGVTDAEVNEDGTLLGTVISPWNGALNSWRTLLTTASLPPVVLHSVGLTLPGVPTPITSMTVDPVVSTQRRRLGRR